MLYNNITDEGMSFSVKANGRTLPFEEWKATDDIIYYCSLSTLVDNGNAYVRGEECVVPFHSLYLLDKDELAMLKVPSKYDKGISLRSEGNLRMPTFKYKVRFMSNSAGGDILLFEGRQGNIVSIGGQRYLLGSSQYQLICAVDEYNATPQIDKTFEYNLLKFSEIKKLADESRCKLDSYLSNESVTVAEKVKIEIKRDDEGYKIEPTVDVDDSHRFTDAFEKQRIVTSVYPLQNDKGERTRVVLDEEQRETLAILKRNGTRNKTREQIRELIEHAPELFNQEKTDISELYSDRVIEIGIYKPKFYPFVSPYKSDWLAGATIETPENGTADLLIKTEDDLAELKEAIIAAEDSQSDIVNYRDTSIGIDDARTLSDIARRQLDDKSEPVKGVKQRKVLIIEENTEKVGYGVNTKQLDVKRHFTLHRNSHLNRDFTLKRHQEEGIAWLQYLYEQQASGCLIADDMGLGKTLQVLYFIDWHARKHPDHKPYLIVAPVSLLENWENEYKRFFSEPRLDVGRLTSKDVSRSLDHDMIGKMQKMGIILTNYESLRNAQLNFCAVDFDMVVLDEAQKVKSPGTLATNAVKALKGTFKIAMTGTPVENSLLDLWCIMDFCVPGLMGNARSFARQYQAPLKKPDVDLDAMGKEIHGKMGIYFLRRMKSEVARDLPHKEIITRKIEMPSVQSEAYQSIVNDYRSGQQPDMLKAIHQLRCVAEHPFIFSADYENRSDEELVESSARLQATIAFIDKIKNMGDKVIVFALFRETQRMLQRIFHNRYGIVAKIINGDTPPTVKASHSNKMSRQGSINYFQSVDGFNIIIMSPIAAGMGLNVTAANHVIHYSRHWNPAKENQATDRAYRIGQTKDVYVYYPMAVSSRFKAFDETLDELLSRKTELATSTIFPTERVEVKKEELAQMLFSNFEKRL